MASDKASKHLWLNYAQQLQKATGYSLGKDEAFFLASQAQKGPVAGAGIPDEYPKLGFYQLGNNVLTTDNLFYRPSSDDGYAGALLDYLNYIELGDDGSPALRVALENALNQASAAREMFTREQDKALQRWNKEKSYGIIDPNFGFGEYIAQARYPPVLVAKKQMDASSAAVAQLLVMTNGPLGKSVIEDNNKVDNALSKTDFRSGFNMQVAYGKVLSSAELTKKRALKEQVPAPSTTLVPAYDIPSYKTMLQNAEEKLAGKFDPAQSASFTLQTNENQDMNSFNFGQNLDGGLESVNYPSWISFKNDFNDDEWAYLNIGSVNSVKVIYSSIETLPVNIGSWNVDLSKYKLKSDAPVQLKKLVRTTQVVVATGLGLEITVGPRTAQEVDVNLRKAKEAGSSACVMGIAADIAARGRGENSHTLTWDLAVGVMKVVPNFEAGCVTVVGAIGQKVAH